MSTMWRSRWAAVGAAVAVTLGAGGIGFVAATAPAGAVAYVPLDEPCRAADTRPQQQFNIGPRNTPLGADDTHTINANDGDCAGEVPSAATSVLLNVTAVEATAPTFLTVWASGALPTASSLNPAPGQPPAPNAVTTGITGANDFQIFNKFGEVHVIVDVVGYYTDHDHDDRYYTETEVDSLLAAKTNAADVYTKAEVDALLAAQPTVLTAAVDSTGTFVRGSAGTTSSPVGTGWYEVDFGQDVTGCVYTATSGNFDVLAISDTNVVVAPRDGNSDAVFVQITNLSGTRVDDDLFLTVIC